LTLPHLAAQAGGHLHVDPGPGPRLGGAEPRRRARELRQLQHLRGLLGRPPPAAGHREQVPHGARDPVHPRGGVPGQGRQLLRWHQIGVLRGGRQQLEVRADVR
ncbi:MAG: hypothetical protein ACK559_08760, partial [bacterium]